MELRKLSETETALTLGWTPPANVGGYVLYANGKIVSVATANLKDGTPRNSAKFSKTSPGPPFEVAALTRSAFMAFTAEADSYPDAAPPPPSSGVLRDHFTDFFTGWGYSTSDHNGQIFQNRWKQPNLQTLSTTQAPWPSTGGPAISEVTDSSGRPGFRFVCNPEMEMDPGSSSKKVEIYEGGPSNPYGQKMIRGLGFTDEIAFYIRFPRSGNPNGFPGPNEGVYDRRNVIWQHSMDGANKLHLFGISRLGFNNRFYLSIFRDSAASTEKAGITLPWEVELDTEYHFRYVIKWASDSSGFFQWWVKRPSDSAEVQYADYTGVTWGSTPNTEFGFYSAKFFNNEVVDSDIRVTQH